MTSESQRQDPENLLDETLAHCFDCMDRGETVGQEVYVNLPPELASELRVLLKVANFVETSAREAGMSTSENANPQGSTASGKNAVAENDAAWSEPTLHYSESNSPPEETAILSADLIGIAGDYELIEEIGRGGMGVVFRARQANLNRIVAVKMILSGKMASEMELQRFYSEARAVARLRHRNIVSIYDVQEDDGHHFYSMDYIEGRTLEDIAAREQLTERQIATYMTLIADAVEYAHQNGILHRDLKPANVLVDADDQPHVTDFGLAKQLEDDSGMTLSGTILGTPSFMSPEQAEGRNEDVGPTSDVYALGAMLYQLLTGKPPFRGRTSAETIAMVINQEPHPIRSFNPRISRPLMTICEKCLRKNPDERYQTAQELAVELDRFLRGDPIQAQPVSRFRHAWVWCRDIPLVAALIGRTPSTSNRWQVRFQWTLLGAFFLWSIAYTGMQIRAAMLPDEIVIASGMKQGMYDGVSQQLANSLSEGTGKEVHLLTSEGSIENLDLLVQGKAHLGLLEASVLDVEQISVVAPLYREFAHVIVPANSDIEKLPDLLGKTIAIGPFGSGNRVSSEKILAFFDITEKNARFSETHFSDLAHDFDVAIAVTGLKNESLKELLATGEYRLLPIPPREEIFLGTGFYPATLKRGQNADGAIDEELPTVATAALLVVREGERDAIVLAACETLLRDDWLETLPGHFSPESFAYLTRALPMHPVAAHFFKTHRPLKPLENLSPMP